MMLGLVRSSTALLLALVHCTAFAEEPALGQADPQIAYHARRRTSQLLAGKDSQDVGGILFNSTAWQFEDDGRLVSYHELPDCRAETTQLVPVFQSTPGTDEFDVVYFNSKEAAELDQARRYRGRALPYLPALVRDPETGSPEHWQVFARFVQIRCLPTRFRFVTIGASRYIEYRMGKSAWK